jgi:hypothetical protein
MIHLHKLPSPHRIAQTLKCLTIKKTLKIGKNGVKEDLMVSLDVDKLSQKMYHPSILLQPTLACIFPSSVSHLTSKAKHLRKPSHRANSLKEKPQLQKT